MNDGWPHARRTSGAATQPMGSPFSRLYIVDLTSGVAIDIGQIGTGELVVGLAIEVGPRCDAP